jgi:hypothetical protein
VKLSHRGVVRYLSGVLFCRGPNLKSNDYQLSTNPYAAVGVNLGGIQSNSGAGARENKNFSKIFTPFPTTTYENPELIINKIFGTNTQVPLEGGGLLEQQLQKAACF